MWLIKFKHGIDSCTIVNKDVMYVCNYNRGIGSYSYAIINKMIHE